MTRILGISGSVRRDSHNVGLLRAAGEALPVGAEFVEWRDLSGLPIFDEDLEADVPEAVAAFRAELESADAVVIATPEYNSSLPGGLKNALDWASRPYKTNALRGKPVAVIGASTGLFGAVWAQADARKVLTTIGARVLDSELAVGLAGSAFDADGALVDPEHAARLEEIVTALTAEVAVDLEVVA